MKRKMVYIGLPVLLGMIFASFLNNSSDYIVVPFIVLAAAFLKYSAKMKNIEVMVCIASFAAGFSAYRFDEQLVYNKIISYSGQKVVFLPEKLPVFQIIQAIKLHIRSKAGLMVFSLLQCFIMVMLQTVSTVMR